MVQTIFVCGLPKVAQAIAVHGLRRRQTTYNDRLPHYISSDADHRSLWPAQAAEDTGDGLAGPRRPIAPGARNRRYASMAAIRSASFGTTTGWLPNVEASFCPPGAVNCPVWYL